MLPLATHCWGCLYCGLFTLPLQSKQGMVSEMGTEKSQEKESKA